MQRSKRQLFKLMYDIDDALTLILLFNNSTDSYISKPSAEKGIDLTYYLRVMALGCAEYEFSYLSYCHHAFLSIKKLMAYLTLQTNDNYDDPSINETVQEFLDEVIASIIMSGFPYPNKIVVDMQDYEGQVKCDIFTFPVPTKESISVIVRKMQRKMHGEGQQAVGYVMWSSAVILSRILCKYQDNLIAGKTVLEIACGLGLCGITAASFSDEVTITDFNEAVLKHLVKNVSVNSGNGVVIEGASPVIRESCNVQVRRLDWDNLSVQRSVHVRYKDFSVKGVDAANDANIIMQEKEISILPHQVNVDNPCKALSTFGTDFPLVDSSAQFDVILSSDPVCQAVDSLGLVKVVLNHLKIGGLFLCVCPLPYFRYGTEVVIPALHAAGLSVVYAPLAHGKCGARYTEARFSAAMAEFLAEETPLQPMLDQLVGDDSLLEGLSEVEFTVYMLICASRLS